uniref:Uncharacterized protein n=1 Tax=Mastacembelus armatus TaxID=205130 RepID=A0A3Q3LMJ0_9TELE
MAKKSCSAGYKWDSLVQNCVQEDTKATLEDTTPTPQLMVLSPALWIFVVLATVGSVVALALWFIIYRRQTSLNDAEPAHEPLEKTELLVTTVQPPVSERNGQAEMFHVATEAPSPCSHLYLGAQTSPKWEDGFSACRGPPEHNGKGVGRGLPACSTMSEHRIPLPATELGGTALVTTKTV